MLSQRDVQRNPGAGDGEGTLREGRAQLGHISETLRSREFVLSLLRQNAVRAVDVCTQKIIRALCTRCQKQIIDRNRGNDGPTRREGLAPTGKVAIYEFDSRRRCD